MYEFVDLCKILFNQFSGKSEVTSEYIIVSNDISVLSLEKI